MDADQIARLSRKLLRSPLVEDGEVFIHSTSYKDELARLEGALAEKTRVLVDEIRALVPTDFSFGLVFTLRGVDVNIDFEDGNTGSMAESFSFTSRKSLRRTLQRLKWDELRKEGIEGGDIFDELLSMADDRPPAIPSSQEAANAHTADLSEAFKEIRNQSPLRAFALVVTRDCDGTTIEYFESRDETVFAIADRMTVGCDILAVLERGVAWSFPEIETAKLEAVEQLGPISRAKAERRFLV